MKLKYFLTSSVIILVFTFLFWCSESGLSGKQSSAFLQNHFFPPLQKMSSLLTDLKFSLRGSVAKKNNIVIVDIDEPSLEQVGRWPWRRDYLAFLINKIFEKGARYVVLDLLFPEPQEAVPEELKQILVQRKLDKFLTPFQFDGVLAETFKRYQDRLTVGWLSEAPCRPKYQSPSECPINNLEALDTIPNDFSRFSNGKVPKNFENIRSSLVASPTVTTNIPLLQASTKNLGFVNGFRDTDGAIRKSSLFFLVENHLYPSLALAAAQMVRNERLEVEWDSSQLISHAFWKNSLINVSVSSNAMIPIQFRGPAYTFPYVSAVELLKENRERQIASDENILKGAIAFVGISALALSDLVATPYGREVPGVEVQATILDNFLSNDFIHPSSNSFFIIFIAMAFGALLFSWGLQKLNRYFLVLNFFMVIVPIFYFDVFYLFSVKNQDWNSAFLYIEYFLITLSFLVLRYLDGENDKAFLRAAFSKYVSPKIVEAIIQDPKSLSLGGRKENLSVLFCDIRDFTTYSESMDAKRLSEFLIDFHSRMTDILFENQGTLDKYIGDAMMAFWGAPVYQSGHALLATQAAMQIAKTVEEKREYYQKEFGIPVRIGIGLNWGPMTVGNMGSRNAFGYTVVGDEVNLASRLESLTKVFRTPILTTGNVIREVEKSKTPNIFYRFLGDIQVKGRAQSISVYALDIDARMAEFYPEFQEALSTFQIANLEKAYSIFYKLNQKIFEKLKIEDGPTLSYLERISKLRNSTEKFNPVWIFSEK